MVHFLLHLGALAAINWTDSEGSTALHYAALHCDPEYVEVTVPPLASVTLIDLSSQYLLICGANISIRNRRNRLPIEEAKVSPIDSYPLLICLRRADGGRWLQSSARLAIAQECESIKSPIWRAK
jgi:ankyrin repeat protein